MNAITPSVPASLGSTPALSSGHQSGASQNDIATVGQEFESVFLSMLLKNMRATVSEDGMFAGDNSDTFGSMFDLFMSQHLAESDSLGIGNMINGFLGNNEVSTNGK